MKHIRKFDDAARMDGIIRLELLNNPTKYFPETEDAANVWHLLQMLGTEYIQLTDSITINGGQQWTEELDNNDWVFTKTTTTHAYDGTYVYDGMMKVDENPFNPNWGTVEYIRFKCGNNYVYASPVSEPFNPSDSEDTYGDEFWKSVVIVDVSVAPQTLIKISASVNRTITYPTWMDVENLKLEGTDPFTGRLYYDGGQYENQDHSVVLDLSANRGFPHIGYNSFGDTYSETSQRWMSFASYTATDMDSETIEQYLEPFVGYTTGGAVAGFHGFYLNSTAQQPEAFGTTERGGAKTAQNPFTIFQCASSSTSTEITMENGRKFTGYGWIDESTSSKEAAAANYYTTTRNPKPFDVVYAINQAGFGYEKGHVILNTYCPGGRRVQYNTKVPATFIHGDAGEITV